MRQCKTCQCTEEAACPGGCFWIAPDKCSACAIRELVEAGIEATPLIVAQQILRDERYRTHQLPEMYAQLPLVALAAIINTLTGRCALIEAAKVAIHRSAEEAGQALIHDTRVALDTYDRLAMHGYAPSREEIGAIFNENGTPPSPLAAPP